MAIIKQVGVGRKASGTIDGITYYTRNGVTYARSTPTMPARMFKTPAALKRQAIFKMVQMHLRYHQFTIKQTFTPKGNGNPYNRYHAENGIKIAMKDGFEEVFLTGAWPNVITLSSSGSGNTTVTVA